VFDLLLREGRVVAPEGQLLALDVGVIDGRIAALGPDVTAPAGQVVSARGCLVLPGVIDLHTHLRSPQGEAGLFTGETASAVAGGVTLVGDFAYPPGSRFELDFAAKRARLAQEAVCDFVLHTVVRSAEDLQRAGTYTVKVFFTASGLGAQTQGALALLQEAVAAGHQVLAHVESLPDYLAILQHGLQAGPGRVHILHVAHQRLVGAVAAFQEPRVTMETCPHYLLWEWVRGRPGCTVNPPVVPADLWPAVRAGQIGTIGTDHCSYTWAEKETLGLPGFPATEQLLRLIATAGVQAGRISWADLLRLLCSGPARVLGLYPRKGALQVGSDADLVLFDPAAEEELGKPAYGRGDFSPYAGLRVFGRVVRTMVRGRTVYADGVADMSAAGWGRWQDAQGI
jgi:dihydroorotase-like cyclic amidohydrolase